MARLHLLEHNIQVGGHLGDQRGNIFEEPVLIRRGAHRRDGCSPVVNLRREVTRAMIPPMIARLVPSTDAQLSAFPTPSVSPTTTSSAKPTANTTTAPAWTRSRASGPDVGGLTPRHRAPSGGITVHYPQHGGIGRLSPNGRMQRAHCAGGHGATRPLDVSVDTAGIRRSRWGNASCPVPSLARWVSDALRQAPILPVNASRVQTGSDQHADTEQHQHPPPGPG